MKCGPDIIVLEDLSSDSSAESKLSMRPRPNWKVCQNFTSGSRTHSGEQSRTISYCSPSQQMINFSCASVENNVVFLLEGHDSQNQLLLDG